MQQAGLCIGRPTNDVRSLLDAEPAKWTSGTNKDNSHLPARWYALSAFASTIKARCPDLEPRQFLPIELIIRVKANSLS